MLENEEEDQPIILNGSIFNLLKRFVRTLRPIFRSALLRFEEKLTAEITDSLEPIGKDKCFPERCLIFDLQFLSLDRHQYLGNVTYFETSNRKNVANTIKAYIDDLILCDIRVIATVSSGQPEMVKILNELNAVKSNKGILTYRVGRHGEFLHVFDSSWLLREFHKVFLTNNITFEQDGIKKKARYKDITECVLTRKLLADKSLSVTTSSVKLFSCTLGCILLPHNNPNRDIQHKIHGTSDLCHFMDALFDTFNSNSNYTTGKQYRKFYSEASVHKEFWKEAIQILATMSTEPPEIVLLKQDKNKKSGITKYKKHKTNMNSMGNTTLNQGTVNVAHANDETDENVIVARAQKKIYDITHKVQQIVDVIKGPSGDAEQLFDELQSDMDSFYNRFVNGKEAPIVKPESIDTFESYNAYTFENHQRQLRTSSLNDHVINENVKSHSEINTAACEETKKMKPNKKTKPKNKKSIKIDAMIDTERTSIKHAGDIQINDIPKGTEDKIPITSDSIANCTYNSPLKNGLIPMTSNSTDLAELDLSIDEEDNQLNFSRELFQVIKQTNNKNKTISNSINVDDYNLYCDADTSKPKNSDINTRTKESVKLPSVTENYSKSNTNYADMSLNKPKRPNINKNHIQEGDSPMNLLPSGKFKSKTIDGTQSTQIEINAEETDSKANGVQELYLHKPNNKCVDKVAINKVDLNKYNCPITLEECSDGDPIDAFRKEIVSVKKLINKLGTMVKLPGFEEILILLDLLKSEQEKCMSHIPKKLTELQVNCHIADIIENGLIPITLKLESCCEIKEVKEATSLEIIKILQSFLKNNVVRTVVPQLASSQEHLDLRDIDIFEMWTLSIKAMMEITDVAMQNHACVVNTKFFNCDAINNHIYNIQSLNGLPRSKIVENDYTPLLDSSLQYYSFTQVCNFTVC